MNMHTRVWTKSNKWTPEQDEFLKSHHARGLSFSAISKRLADEMGATYSRNACIGRASRLGLVHVTHFPTQNKRPRIHKPRPNRKRTPPKFKIVPIPQDVPAPTTDYLCQLLQLTNCSCRWPIGEPGQEGFFFCGTPEADFRVGKSYCNFHRLASVGKRVAA